MITIFSATYTEAMIVKNLFENESIEVFTINEVMSNVEPWAVCSGGYNSISLNVRKEDFEKASILLEKYKSGELDLDA